MIKKALLFVFISILLVIVWQNLSPFSMPKENTSDTLGTELFKAAQLDLQPTIPSPVDAPTQLKPILLTLLKEQDFDALDEKIESLALKFDAGEISPSDLDNIIDNIAQIDPDLEQVILNWISHSESWASYLVASRYFNGLSWQWRGKAYWSEIPTQNRKKFRAYQALARAVGDKAKQDNNRDVLWYSDQISFANLDDTVDEVDIIYQALEKFPTSVLIHHSAIIAQTAKWGGNEYFRQELIHSYATILDKASHDGGATISYYRANDAADRKDYITAIREIKSAIKQEPNRLYYYSMLAELYYKTDQFPLALTAINTTLKTRSNRGNDLLTRANILLKADMPERALEDLKTLLSFSPMHKEANTKAFSAYAKLGLRDKALATLKRVGYFTQYNPKELSRQGFFARYDLKDIDLAKQYYQRALTINSRNAAAHYAFSTMYGNEANCKVVNHLYQYLQSCNSEGDYSQHWCKPRYKNWAISSVNHLINNQRCPEINSYSFAGLF